MDRDKSLTIHQVEEVEELVQDALERLDQVQYALGTLQQRLKDQKEEQGQGPGGQPGT